MFVKGQSGNPGGRKAMPEELKKTILDSVPGVVQFWIDTYQDRHAKWEHRNKAAENLVAYGYGKAKEMIDMEHSGKIDGFVINIVKKTDVGD